MSEERIYEAPETENTSYEQPNGQPNGQQYSQQPVYAQPVKAKTGLATAALVFGILAFITTLFFLNYLFGLLALILGIIYLVKKAEIKPKGKAITGIVLAAVSLIVSTTLWVGLYNYITKTDVTDIITDVTGLVGEPVDGEEMLNNVIAEATGNAVDLETIEAFVGEEITLERVMDFVGDTNEQEITSFMNEVTTYDEATLQSIAQEFEGEITYQKLEEKVGEDFTLEELMEYVRSFKE